MGSKANGGDGGNTRASTPAGTGSNSSGGGGGGSSSGNTYEAIARLLYAMLKQKSLKDIDWNQVARDPVLLEEISNGHAARMRYSRFRAAVENQNGSEKKASARSGRGFGVPRSSSTENHGASLSSSTSSVMKSKVTKPRRDSTGGIRGKKHIRRDEGKGEKNTAGGQGSEVQNGRESDRNQEQSKDPVQNRNPDQNQNQDQNKDCKEDITATLSFTSSLPSPPQETSLTLENTPKTQKMCLFSPALVKAEPALVPQHISSSLAPPMRIQSMPSLFTQLSSHNHPNNLGGTAMMRHHSADSASEISLPPPTGRLMTPSSDMDLHQTQRQQVARAPVTMAPGASDAFNFTFATARTAEAAVMHYASHSGNENNQSSQNNHPTSHHGSPAWMPFSPPSLAHFDISPYTTGLGIDSFPGSSGNSSSAANGNQHNFYPLMNRQSPQQQQHTLLVEQTLQPHYLSNAFAKHGTGWDTLLGQASDRDANNMHGGHSHHEHSI